MFKTDVYISRRRALRSKISNGIVLILGNGDVPMNYIANTYQFRQDSSFLYFFGLNSQNLAGVLDIDSGQDYIYGNDVEIDDIIWMGPQPSLKDRAAKVGVKNTSPFNNLFEMVSDAIKKGRKVHFLPPYRAENIFLLESLLGIHNSKVKQYVSVDLIKAIVSLRSIKDEYEITEIEKAAAIGYEMHTAAMKMAKPGIYEREIAGHIEGIALSHGGSISFPVILSVNGETLHNHYHGNKLREGRMLLTDAGAETPMCYTSDFTRTIPVTGKFSQKQKEIYEIVLAANNKAREATKPGVKYQDIHLLSARVIASGLKELGLMKGDVDEAVKSGAHAMFFPHGLGHMMGLDVHDMEDLGENYVGYDEHTSRIDQFGTAYLRLGRKLETGFVITNEPGIYFIPALIDKWKNENINNQFINFDKVNEYRDFGGIRLEDDILVTENGSRLLGKRIPITVDEIESIMK
ncbi:MAG: aminopeptidase P family protein [Bacteroidota bacterium]|nr:aminopeptidase P family protein [Bacteroidota bacterium]